MPSLALHRPRPVSKTSGGDHPHFFPLFFLPTDPCNIDVCVLRTDAFYMLMCARLSALVFLADDVAKGHVKE